MAGYVRGAGRTDPGSLSRTLALASAFGLSLSCSLAQPNVAPGRGSPLLTNVDQVLRVGLDQARSASVEAELQGVVTLAVGSLRRIYVQDATAGVQVTYTNADVSPSLGDRVRVTGRVGAGTFTPIVKNAQARIIGNGPMPKPLAAGAASLVAGEHYGQWVEVEGSIRDVAWSMDHLILFVSSGGLRFHAIVQPHSQRELPTDWLDARVALRGVCLTDANQEGKPMGFTLYAPGASFLEFRHPGASNLLAGWSAQSPSRAELLQQSDDRLRVRGTVLFHSAQDVLYLNTASGPLQARLLVPLAKVNPEGLYLERPKVPRLRPGAQVELVGAPRNSSLAPSLQDAQFRVVTQGPPPAPKAISAGDAVSGAFDCTLVALQARLLKHERRELGTSVQESLLLESGRTIFSGFCELSRTNALPDWPNDSLLAVTGMCLAEPAGSAGNHPFQLRLRDAADVRRLGQTPFWMRRDAARLLASGAGVLALGALWILMLRRQVRQRTTDLATANQSLLREVGEREKAQTELKRALAAERELGELKSRFVSLVSHEFRTPLGITMSAVELLRSYLDRLPPPKLRELLDDIHASTLRMSGMMEQVLLLGRVEAGRLGGQRSPIDLGAFCARLVDESLSATQRKCPINLRSNGELAGAGADESLLRHIFSNLLSNAVKYSPAGASVELQVCRQSGMVSFAVRDSGIGIPEAEVPHLFQAFRRGSNVADVPGTGLGLLIVKRCVELHGGTIEIDSRVGVGTTITVNLPLFASEAAPA
jgi:signal transduction histidine kinase